MSEQEPSLETAKIKYILVDIDPETVPPQVSVSYVVQKWFKRL
jgi:hypothetical protein